MRYGIIAKLIALVATGTTLFCGTTTAADSRPLADLDPSVTTTPESASSGDALPTAVGVCDGVTAPVSDELPDRFNSHNKGLFLDAPSDAAGASDPMLSVQPSSVGAASFFKIEQKDVLQLVGEVSGPRLHEIRFSHVLLCDDKRASVDLEIHDDGSASLAIGIPDNGIKTIGIARPWAVDSNGQPVPTWYEARGADLVQIIDGQDAAGPIAFDPTYSAITCSSHYSDQGAYFYLNMWDTDPGVCPVMGMFNSPSSNDYTPVWGWEANVANDYGKIAIKQDGDCSSSPDTGWAWDFQVPCKAHDYCYDLRKASFAGTVSDGDCDSQFYWLMEAHCNDRVLAGDCRTVRDAYFLAVSAPGVVTDPNPGLVEIRNRMTAKCADIEGPSSADNTPIQQWSCAGVSNQRFRIWPAPGAPGYFNIKPTNSSKCARALNDPVQWSCVDTWDSQRFRIQGALNQDQYSIRSKYSQGECWKVPNSWTNGVDLVDPACDDYSNWYIWRIVDV